MFQLTPSSTGWEPEVLDSFCSEPVGIACTDGVSPSARLIMDAPGDLMGITNAGGATGGGGVVFELTSNQSTDRVDGPGIPRQQFLFQGGGDRADGAWCSLAA